MRCTTARLAVFPNRQPLADVNSCMTWKLDTARESDLLSNEGALSGRPHTVFAAGPNTVCTLLFPTLSTAANAFVTRPVTRPGFWLVREDEGDARASVVYYSVCPRSISPRGSCGIG